MAASFMGWEPPCWNCMVPWDGPRLRPGRRIPEKPPLTASFMVRAAVTDQRTNSKEPKTVAARAEPHTAPRQKSSFDRKTPRATKPAK